MTFYNARFERDRRESMTQDRILQVAQRAGIFTVSLRWRDDWLRKRCHKLKQKGLLRGGKRHGREIVYRPAECGREQHDMDARLPEGHGRQ